MGKGNNQPLTTAATNLAWSYFGGGTGSPNLGWRAPGMAEPAALSAAVAGFVGDAGDAVAAGRSGSGAGLSSPWHPDTTNTETLPTTSAMTGRNKDEILIDTSLDPRLFASTPHRGDMD
jgi:hypothetical protein